MNRGQHVHKPSCLGAWSGCAVPLSYEEWVRLAGAHHNQNHAWRQHELHARMNEHAKKDLSPWYYDLGGES